MKGVLKENEVYQRNSPIFRHNFFNILFNISSFPSEFNVEQEGDFFDELTIKMDDINRIIYMFDIIMLILFIIVLLLSFYLLAKVIGSYFVNLA